MGLYESYKRFSQLVKHTWYDGIGLNVRTEKRVTLLADWLRHDRGRRRHVLCHAAINGQVDGSEVNGLLFQMASPLALAPVCLWALNDGFDWAVDTVAVPPPRGESRQSAIAIGTVDVMAVALIHSANLRLDIRFTGSLVVARTKRYAKAESLRRLSQELVEFSRLPPEGRTEPRLNSSRVLKLASVVVLASVADYDSGRLLDPRLQVSPISVLPTQDGQFAYQREFRSIIRADHTYASLSDCNGDADEAIGESWPNVPKLVLRTISLAVPSRPYQVEP